MTLLMPRTHDCGDDPQTPPLGRIPASEEVPEVWRGIGGLKMHRPAGKLYGRSLRKRALIRLLWMIAIAVLLVAGIAVPVIAAALRMLVL